MRFPLPTPKQARTLLRATRRWNLFIGATRSGKTFLQYILAPVRCAEVPQRGLSVLLAKTMGKVETNLLSPMRDLYGARYVSEMYQRGKLTRAKLFGREFVVCGADNKASIDRIRGMSIALLLGDEGPTWPADLLQMLKTRLDQPWAVADITGNPEYPLHPFKTDLIDRADDLDLYCETFTLDDNPRLDAAVRANLKRELRGVWYQRLVLGKWVAAEGAIYDMLTEDNYYDASTRPPALSGMPRYIAVDYGTTNPCVFLDIYDDGHIIHVDREWVWDSRKRFSQLTDDQYADAFEQFLGNAEDYPPAGIIVDPSAASFITALKARGFLVTTADNAVLDGIRRTATLFQRGLIRLNRDWCPTTILELQGYGWDDNAARMGKEEPKKVADHGPDGVRYFVNTALPSWRIGVYEQ